MRRWIILSCTDCRTAIRFAVEETGRTPLGHRAELLAFLVDHGDTHFATVATETDNDRAEAFIRDVTLGRA